MPSESEYGSVQTGSSSIETSPLNGLDYIHNGGSDRTNPHDSELHRHLTLFDLVCVGVGATVGSGVFVLTGLIARNQAGPATFISWLIAGAAACASGLCYAELGGRFPSAGSSYTYARNTMGECAAVIAGACLTLEYIGSASAVARSWGDKVVEYVKSFENENNGGSLWWEITLFTLDPGLGINPCAFLVCLGSVLLLLDGVKESKLVANTFTSLKVVLVVFMCGLGLGLMKSENMAPLVPAEFGAGGIIRGATSSFFGYIGYDEICCIAGEAIDPSRNMPRAIILTLIIVTTLYVTAAIALTGMVPYTDISETSGFPDGFRYRGMEWAAQLSALGELISLPLVVLVTVMAQPRLQYAMALDGLLPPIFSEMDQSGNLIVGTRIAGIIMTIIATLVPFVYLDDLVSAGILLAFTMTDASVVLIRQSSPSGNPFLLERLMVWFHILSLLSGFLLKNCLSMEVTGESMQFLTLVSCLSTVFIGNRIRTQCPSKKTLMQWHSNEPGMFLTPFVPILPLSGSFVNLYLIAQLEKTGLIMITCYVGLAVGCYHYFMHYRKHENSHRNDPPERMLSLHETKRDTNN